MTGLVFGRLTIIKRVSRPSHINSKHKYYLCSCICGGKVVTRGERLKAGRTKSCGCLQNEIRKHIRSKTQGGCLVKHGHCVGGKLTSEYRAWQNIIDRCENSKNKRYHRYGGRGIRICDRWRNNFLYFYEDMGPRPSEFYSIDRKNNDGDYEPSNCRWATRKEQQRNTNQSILIEFDNKTLCQKDWAILLGLSSFTIAKYTGMGLTIGDIAAYFNVEYKVSYGTDN